MCDCFNLWITVFFASPNRKTAIVREAGAICFRPSAQSSWNSRPFLRPVASCATRWDSMPPDRPCAVIGHTPSRAGQPPFLKTQSRKDLNSTTNRG